MGQEKDWQVGENLEKVRGAALQDQGGVAVAGPAVHVGGCMASCRLRWGECEEAPCENLYLNGRKGRVGHWRGARSGDGLELQELFGFQTLQHRSCSWEAQSKANAKANVWTWLGEHVFGKLKKTTRLNWCFFPKGLEMKDNASNRPSADTSP